MKLSIELEVDALRKLTGAKFISFTQNNEVIVNGLILGKVIGSKHSRISHLVCEGYTPDHTEPDIFDPFSRVGGVVTRDPDYEKKGEP